MAPVIETPRLRLRPHAPADLDVCAALWGDAAVTRFIGGRPFTREEVWARILRYAGHWLWLDFGFWIIEEKDTSRFLGEVGFGDFQRQIIPPLQGIPEIGWVLSPHAHGLGYATEAVGAVVAWGEKHFGAVRTVCIIHPDNVASLRVAARCGYREWRHTEYHGVPITLFERLP